MAIKNEAKSNELRNGILIALLTATITAAGFIGKDYFESKNKQKEYIGELYKNLYDKGAKELEKVNWLILSLTHYMAKDSPFRLTSRNPISKIGKVPCGHT
jgi:hypothetical protein